MCQNSRGFAFSQSNQTRRSRESATCDEKAEPQSRPPRDNHP
jgi:hypothetical protein